MIHLLSYFPTQVPNIMATVKIKLTCTKMRRKIILEQIKQRMINVGCNQGVEESF